MKKELISDKITVTRKMPLNGNVAGFNLPAIKEQETIPAVYLYQLSNALVASHGIVMSGKEIIPESVSYAWRGRARRRTFYKRLFTGQVEIIKEKAVVFHNSYYKNYYHWLLEMMPRLFSIKKYLDDVVILVPNDIGSFQEEMLSFFPCLGIKKFSVKKVAFAKELLLPDEPMPDYGIHNPALINAMANWMKKCVGITEESLPQIKKRIFIIREKDKVRKLINSEEVAGLLKEYNFEPVMLEGKSVKEQIKIFNSAECVAGVQGAGLSNMIFMPKNSLVINFLNEKHNDVCFFNLANAVGHRIIIQQCETVGETDLHPQHYNMQVDLKELKSYLEKFVNKE